MPANCLAYACGREEIPSAIEGCPGWTVWCKNNEKKATLSWGYLACAVVYLATVTGGRPDKKNVFRSKETINGYGRDLLRLLTGKSDGEFLRGRDRIPAEGDLLICGTPADPHYVRYTDGLYTGQPATADIQFEAMVHGDSLTQYTDIAGGKRVYGIRGAFR
ncbi:hypothetical protein [Desulfoluna spongiiphila]|uniref:Uncharacterized protein n=1 Tax=Desulfoluna spongiiphila TaxID=419481 RepID=A0A1G5DKT3_9BACT|nr:hypothetical protein [Desulfoluna spongiiphila]SCY15121.1 hypothetical protein SAMN05216233_104239 [Desulfoluna spongiiphila]VVS95085.1 hypothetical protein DBB_46620 [Desulfoluna spongiiphila]